MSQLVGWAGGDRVITADRDRDRDRDRRRRPWRPWPAVALTGVTSALLIMTIFAGAVTPAAAAKQLKLPSTAGGCATAPSAVGSAVAVPIAVTHSHDFTLAMISVCINGKGPFPLVLDSGATSSQLDRKVVNALHLPSAGKPLKATGVNCPTSDLPVKVSNWSIGPVALAGQTVGSSRIPHFGLHQAPAGLLGSDVLSRFGAVRIDYKSQKLILPGAEGPAPGKAVKAIKGPSTTPTPTDLVSGYPVQTAIPIDVASLDGQVIVLAPVRFASFPSGLFIVDTGASASAVAASTASSLKLTKLKTRAKIDGVACTSTDAQVKSGKWTLSTTPLASQTLTAIKLPGLAQDGVEGVLGSDQLSSFGSVVIDYAGGRLLI